MPKFIRTVLRGVAAVVSAPSRFFTELQLRQVGLKGRHAQEPLRLSAWLMSMLWGRLLAWAAFVSIAAILTVGSLSGWMAGDNVVGAFRVPQTTKEHIFVWAVWVLSVSKLVGTYRTLCIARAMRKRQQLGAEGSQKSSSSPGDEAWTSIWPR